MAQLVFRVPPIDISGPHLRQKAVQTITQVHNVTFNDTKSKQRKKFEELQNKIRERNNNENDSGNQIEVGGQ